MNRTFKVVFNRARAGLMVANEIISSVQKKGTKTVVAVGVAMLVASGAVLAEDIPYSQDSGNKGYESATTESKVFSSDDVLKMTITGTDTRAYGLLATGKDATYTNQGKIEVNLANNDATSPWQVKGMMADAGGTAVNEGTIEVTKAYGMTVGSSGDTNTIINKGTINVTESFGVGMEAAPTGSTGTTGTAKAVASNEGVIKVTPEKSIGILVSGDNGRITNAGTIDATGDAVVIQREKGKSASGNAVIFKAGSVTKGAVAVIATKVGEKDFVAPETTTLTFDKGATFDGAISVTSTASGTKLVANGQSFQNKKGDFGGAIFFGDAKGSIDLTDTTFVNNTVSGADVYGGAVYSYGSPFKQTGGIYSGNQALSTGADVNTKGLNQTGAGGGALMMKGNKESVLTDVVFVNNSAQAKKTDETTGGYAYGGAVMVDYSTGAASGVERASDVKFAITEGKEITYSGNTVSSDSTAKSFDTYGYHVNSAAAGGFLFLDRGSAADFDIADGAKLTLGSTVTQDDTDSIASSIRNKDCTNKEIPVHARITKSGNGELVVNSSLNKYFGMVDVKVGTVTVNSDWIIKNAVTVDKGAVLNLSNSNYGFDYMEGGSTTRGTLKVSGELISKIGSVFESESKPASLDSTSVTKKADFTFENGSILTLTDEGQYKIGLLNSLAEAANSNHSTDINLLNASVTLEGTAGDVEINSNVTTLALSGQQKITINKSLTLNGAGETSSIKELMFTGQGNAQLLAKNNTIVNVEKLTGNGGVYVGEREGAGAKMFIKELAMDGGHIFVDPLYGHSELHVESLGADSTLYTNITAGAGALVSIGSDANKAKSAVAGIDGIGSASTVVFVGTPMTMGDNGRLIVNPDAQAEDTEQSHAKHVIVQNGGVLVVDQAGIGASPVFTGAHKVSVDSNSKLGIANAAPGTVMLSPTGGDTQLDISGTVLTDNPFVSVAEVSNEAGTVTLEASASQEGMSTLASMGIQSMIRRADMVLAETIADRMASEVQTGSNLWVDVRGERYERDNLDNGAGFKADIGYGAFGAELAPTETTTLGVAFQYGNGTVKGDVASVKNKTKDYGFALYGSAMLGDTGVKGIGEVAYTKSTNDITSSLALMNQDTDATMLSAGVKAQKSFDLGTFEVIPSLGVRVSHIKTDAMQAGNVQIEKQKQTIVQIPLALRVNAKVTETASGWSVTPKFKVAFIPTVGDKSIEVFGVKQSVIDTSPVQGSFGVGFAKGNLTIDAAAHLGAGNKGTSAVGGKVGLTYRF